MLITIFYQGYKKSRLNHIRPPVFGQIPIFENIYLNIKYL